MIHENIELTGSFNVNGTLIIPTHASASSALSTAGSIYNDSTDNVVKLYTGTEWIVVGAQTAPTPVEYLVAAGGGGSGGGGSTGYHGGGGGGGGLLSGSIPATPATFTVTVGAGGSAGAQSGDYGYSGTNGQDSSISGTSITTITSVGGGAGAGNATTSPASRQGNDGGSGGGGALYSGIGGSGTAGQGNDGGNASANYQGAGGGGGAGTVGGNAVSSGGSGGEGTSSSITGTAVYYGGGGAGRGQSGNGAAVNGATAVNTAGATNKGAGGGGRLATSGMAGGSGVAIFAYDSDSFNCAGGIVGDAGNGRKYNQYNSSGTFKVGSTSDFNIVTGSNLVLHVDAGNFASRNGNTSGIDLSSYDNDINLGGQSGGSLTSNPWWNCDGTGGLADFERNGGGTATNTAHTGYGNFTGASATNFTIEFWVRSTATGGDATIGKTIIGRNSGDIWASIGIKNNKLSYIHYNSTWQSNYSTTSINDGNWHHCVVTNFSDQTGDLWVDGTKELDGASTTLSPNAGTRYMRLDSIFRGYNGQNTAGDIAQIRVYDIALTDAQITQNYNATKTNFV